MSFLKRLFGKQKEEAPELPPEFLQSEPPDWLLDLKGTGLPQSGSFSVRVQLWNGSRQGSADIIILPGEEGQEPQNATAPLLKSEIDRLFVVLGFSFPHDIESVVSTVKGGLPVTLSVHRHEPYAVKTTEYNLAGWIDSRQTRPAAVEIGWLLLEIQKRVLPRGEK